MKLLNKFKSFHILGAFVGSFLFHALIISFFDFKLGTPVDIKYVSPTIRATLFESHNIVLEEKHQESVVSDFAQTHTGLTRTSDQLEQFNDNNKIPIYLADRPAKILELGPINLPLELQSYTGILTLDVEINEKGLVSGISILYSSPQGMYDEYVQNALSQAKIEPAIRDGKPVSQTIKLEVKFIGGTLSVGS